MPPKFVPRQRKRKVLAREAAQKEAAQANEQTTDPSSTSTIKGQFPVSKKKAKRLEKYIENKLRKDETRDLLAKLAANKIDTSLFSSTSQLGQTKQTKKQALCQALKEEKAGLALGQSSRQELLYRKREGSSEDDSSTIEEEGPEKGGMLDSVDWAPSNTDIPTSGSQPAPLIAGSGLKRPLEVDDGGRPIIKKRQKRGGVKSKISLARPLAKTSPDLDDEWTGFSEEGGSEASSGLSHQDDDSLADSSEEDTSSDGSSEDDSDDSGSGSDAEESGDETRGPSGFKAWVEAQRNQALGHEPDDPASRILDIPRPANFQPRPVEQDPLPFELQPTQNTERKAFSVEVTRTPQIQASRLALPVVAEEQRIMEAIHNHNVVVICGATGSGKTTQLPQFLFEAGYGSPGSPTPGMIGITQPRRVAAVSMSKRVAQELGDKSQLVGYQIRFEGTVDPGTAVKFMTDGVLLREAAEDLALRKYSAIIIDEAHERSVNTDVLIGMLSRVVKLRAELAQEDPSFKPLKLIIMSATLRIEDLTMNPKLFPTPPPVLEVEGRQFPVTVHFSRRTHHDYVGDSFRKICRGHRKLPPGGMLVFLTGQSEIVQLGKRLKLEFNGTTSVDGPKVRLSTSEAPMEAEDIEFSHVDEAATDDYVDDDDDDGNEEGDWEEEKPEFEIEDEEAGSGPARVHVLPLFSLLPTKDQMRVFEPPPDGSRLIVLATNVAETSLTIPGIRYVFDCGRSKERQYDQLTGVQSFEVGWISKASANQRAGRAGRTGPGHCYRMYSSAVYERDFTEFAVPEIMRMSLEGVILQLKAMNLHHVVNFPFPTRPERQSIVKAEKLLSYLSAVADEGRVTQVGRTMSIFPLSPRFSRILLIGHLHDCLPYTITMVAALSVAEIFIQENQAIPAAAARAEGEIRTNEDIQAENKQAAAREAFNAAHKNFCFLDDKSDAIKLLQVLGEFAHEPTEEWCEKRFVRFKVLQEAQKLRQQIVQLLKTNIPSSFGNLVFEDRLEPPTPKQVSALKQMVAAGFIDHVAIRADKAPVPPEMGRTPRRAIDVPYVPLIPLETSGSPEEDNNSSRLVYIHPSSPLAHRSTAECPDYIVYSYLQRSATSGPMVDVGFGKEGEGEQAQAQQQKKQHSPHPKIRMHSLTDVTGAQLAALAKGTPLISYGKPVKVVSEADWGKTRECWVVPYLKAEGTGGMGWPLPMKKVKQRKMPGKGWVVD